MNYNNQELPSFHIPKQEEEQKKKKKRLLPFWFSGGSKSVGGTLGSHGLSGGARFLGTKAGAAGLFGAKAGGGGFMSFLTSKMGLALVAAALIFGALGLGLFISNSMNNTSLDGPRAMDSRSFLAASDTDAARNVSANDAARSSLELLVEGNRGNETAEAAAYGDQIEEVAIDDLITEAEDPEAAEDVMAAVPSLNTGDGIPKANFGNFGSDKIGTGGKQSFGNFGSKINKERVGGGKGVMGKFDKPNYGDKVDGMKKQTKRAYRRASTSSARARSANDQAKFLRGQLGLAKNMTSVDSAAGVASKAWEGTVSQGDGAITADSGGGIDVGGGTVDDSNFGLPNPNTDNNFVTPATPDVQVPEVDTGTKEGNPWDSLVSTIQMLLMLAAALMIIIGIFGDMGKLPFIGGIMIGIAQALAAVAMALGAVVAVLGVQLMTTHGQMMQGMVFTAAGAAIGIGAGMCVFGGSMTAKLQSIALWTGIAGGLAALVASALG